MIVALVRSCHPGPTVVVTTIAVVLAVAVGLTWTSTTLVGATVLCGQLSIGWSNDWLDARRDRMTGRTDKPVATGEIAVRFVRVAALAALVLSVPLSLANGFAAGLAQLGLVGSGWAYNLGLKRTRWSWLPYAVGFGLLPAFVTLILPGTPWPPWWAVVSGSLLGVGAHFANVLPDIDQDLAQGVRGLPQTLGYRRSGVVAFALLVAASLLLLLSSPGTSPVGKAVGGGVVLLLVLAAVPAFVRSGPGQRVRFPAFRAALLIALVDTILLASSVSAWPLSS